MSALTVPDSAVYFIRPPITDESTLAGVIPDGVLSVDDHGTDIGETQHAAFTHLFARGADAVVLVGSDLPALPAATLREGFAALIDDGADVVLGPAGDGGYYLIGLREPHFELFDGVSWSTDRVLTETLDRATTLGLTVMQLHVWHDVDDAADLVRLVHELASRPDLVAPMTRRIVTTPDIRRAIGAGMSSEDA